MTPAVQLKRDQHIVSLTRDKDGRGHAYVVTDRIGDAVLCSQRLTAAAAWLNQMNETPEDRALIQASHIDRILRAHVLIEPRRSRREPL